MCEQRYRLWSDYDRALKEYTRVMHGIIEGRYGLEEAAEVQRARSGVQDLRSRIERHTRDHRCTPPVDSGYRKAVS